MAKHKEHKNIGQILELVEDFDHRDFELLSKRMQPIERNAYNKYSVEQEELAYKNREKRRQKVNLDKKGEEDHIKFVKGLLKSGSLIKSKGYHGVKQVVGFSTNREDVTALCGWLDRNGKFVHNGSGSASGLRFVVAIYNETTNKWHKIKDLIKLKNNVE